MEAPGNGLLPIYIMGLTRLCKKVGMSPYFNKVLAARSHGFSEPKSRRKYLIWFGNIHNKSTTKIVIITEQE